MIRYSDINDALGAFDKSIFKLDRIGHMGLNPDDFLAIAETIMGEFYNVVEALIYICEYDDSDPNGEQPFVPLKEFPSLRTNMPLTPEIRKDAKEICKGEKPNFKKEITSREFAKFIDAVSKISKWIKENARNERNNISDLADHVEYLADRLLRMFEEFLERQQ